MSRKRLLTQVGLLENGTPVMAGVFRLLDTHGLPLSIVLESMLRLEAQPCWGSFVEEATKAGWKRQTTMLRLEEAICDTYGRAYWLVVEERLNRALNPGGTR